MDEKALLDAIRTVVREATAPINTRLDNMDSRLDTIEGKQDKLSADIAHLNHELVPKVKVIYEGYADQRDKFPRLDVIEGRVGRLEDDVFAVKEHLRAE